MKRYAMFAYDVYYPSGVGATSKVVMTPLKKQRLPVKTVVATTLTLST